MGTRSQASASARALAPTRGGPGWEVAGTREDSPLRWKVGGRATPSTWEAWVQLAWRLRGGAGDQRRPSGGHPGSPLLGVALGTRSSDSVTGWRETRWDAGGRSREVGSGLWDWKSGQPDSPRSSSAPTNAGSSLNTRTGAPPDPGLWPSVLSHGAPILAALYHL